jgi:peptidoglycan-N-acetylglucosamine deacetylase
MKSVAAKNGRWSPAERVGVSLILVAALASLIHAAWALWPLGLYILLCFAASLSPRSRFFLPVISRGRTGRPVVALTFDDGPDPLTTPRLLRVLARHQAKATFFVTGKNALQHPENIREILACGHDIGNHSLNHHPLLMLFPYRRLLHEIVAAQVALRTFGVVALVFRPPVGLTNPKLARVLGSLGLSCVTFSCRAFDRGNRRIRRLSERILRNVRADDIILLHDVRPAADGEAGIERWLAEVERLLAGLPDLGLSIIPLSALIGAPVMMLVGDGPATPSAAGLSKF